MSFLFQLGTFIVRENIATDKASIPYKISISCGGIKHFRIYIHVDKTLSFSDTRKIKGVSIAKYSKNMSGPYNLRSYSSKLY